MRTLSFLLVLGLGAVAPGTAQQSALGVSVGAQTVSVFGWGYGGKNDFIATIAYAERSPVSSGDDRFVEVSLLWGRRPSQWGSGWLRAAVGPALTTHSTGREREGANIFALAGQVDLTAPVLPLSGSRHVALGITARGNLNSRASFFSLALAAHLVRALGRY